MLQLQVNDCLRLSKYCEDAILRLQSWRPCCLVAWWLLGADGPMALNHTMDLTYHRIVT